MFLLLLFIVVLLLLRWLSLELLLQGEFGCSLRSSCIMAKAVAPKAVAAKALAIKKKVKLEKKKETTSKLQDLLGIDESPACKKKNDSKTRSLNETIKKKI